MTTQLDNTLFMKFHVKSFEISSVSGGRAGDSLPSFSRRRGIVFKTGGQAQGAAWPHANPRLTGTQPSSPRWSSLPRWSSPSRWSSPTMWSSPTVSSSPTRRLSPAHKFVQNMVNSLPLRWSGYVMTSQTIWSTGICGQPLVNHQCVGSKCDWKFLSDTMFKFAHYANN